MKKRFAAILLACVLIASMCAIPAFAEEGATTPSASPSSSAEAQNDESTKSLPSDIQAELLDAQGKIDAGGNVFGFNDVYSKTDIATDFYWAGDTLNMTGSTIGADAIAAGNSLSMSDTTVGGSVRIAGSSLSLNGVKIENNILMAGANLDVDSTTSSKTAYLAGAGITYNGTASEAHLAAGNVDFDGTVNGDLYIDADSVLIGSNAKVTGTLYVTASSEPSVPSGASIANLEFTQGNTDSDSAVDAEAGIAAFTGAAIMAKVVGTIYSIISLILLALVYCWLIRKPIEESKDYIKTRTAPFIISGVVGVIVAPMAFILLCCTIVGLPIAMLALCIMLLMTCFGLPFFGAGLGRVIFKKMNRYGSAALTTLILVILAAIPFVNFLVLLCTMIYCMGYLIQKLYMNILENKAAKNGGPLGGYVPPAPTDGVAAPVAGAAATVAASAEAVVDAAPTKPMDAAPTQANDKPGSDGKPVPPTGA